jgi:hypothetical protein
VGVTGAPAFSAPTLDFGSVKINHTSSLTETVTNIGNATLTITSIAIYGTNATDFSKGTDTCTHASLAPGQSCYVVVKFRPEATGLEQAGLGFTDNHFNRTYLDQVVLQGQGVK